MCLSLGAPCQLLSFLLVEAGETLQSTEIQLAFQNKCPSGWIYRGPCCLMEFWSEVWYDCYILCMNVLGATFNCSSTTCKMQRVACSVFPCKSQVVCTHFVCQLRENYDWDILEVSGSRTTEVENLLSASPPSTEGMFLEGHSNYQLSIDPLLNFWNL